MSALSDLLVLKRLAFPRREGETHAERMESFYRDQAAHYDDFRRRLLHGRPFLYRSLKPPANGVWLDLGGGTGSCLDFIEGAGRSLKALYVVDLSPSLLAVARRRAKVIGAEHVRIVEADAATFLPEEGLADVVTLSYSLTMMPDWLATLAHAERMLRPGGRIGVTDFYVSPAAPPPDRARHSWIARKIWPEWFARDGVRLSPFHLPALIRRFETEAVLESSGPIPYLPLVRAPYYVFVGRKRAAAL